MEEGEAQGARAAMGTVARKGDYTFLYLQEPRQSLPQTWNAWKFGITVRCNAKCTTFHNFWQMTRAGFKFRTVRGRDGRRGTKGTNGRGAECGSIMWRVVDGDGRVSCAPERAPVVCNETDITMVV